jgi:UDP-N-acetylglucosamine/UDP-N-acetylgalactosamine diphosphorylase
MDDRYCHLEATLKRYGQAHLLTFYAELSAGQRARLLGQLEALDWPHLAELIKTHVLAKPEPADVSGLKPAPYYPATPGEDLAAKYAEARRVGEALIRGGKVAALTVAGGQGTRLGWDGPKGTFPATPVCGKPLFQVFAEYLLKIREKYGMVPWYLMTSPSNDDETRTFFAEHAYFGLEPEQVVFFVQGTMPSVGYDGKLLLADKGELALSPDGTGGSLKALYREGALDDMQRRGVELISYFQVDNPNVKCIDPLFLGLHALDEAEVSSKMVPKASPEEKVGVFALQGGRPRIVEYSELPRALAEARNPDGTLAFAAGSIAIHVFSCDFVRRVNERGGFSLPYHRADKKVAHLDPASGVHVEPKEPNAVKLEHFAFDALPLAQRTLVLETDRVEEFAPIKNASGVDSPESSKRLQIERAARWLAACGVEVPVDANGNLAVTLELSPLTAIEPGDLRGRELPGRLAPGAVLAL